MFAMTTFTYTPKYLNLKLEIVQSDTLTYLAFLYFALLCSIMVDAAFDLK